MTTTSDSPMEPTFTAQLLMANDQAKLIQVGFGRPAGNEEIVIDAERAFEKGGWRGGFLLLDGAMSLPAAFVIAHKTLHLFCGVAVFDPKKNGYIVVADHGGGHAVGTLVSKTDFGL